MIWVGDNWFEVLFGPLIMVLAMGLSFVCVLYLLRRLGAESARLTMAWAESGTAALTPLNLLKGRLVQGDNDKNEFEERRRIFG